MEKPTSPVLSVVITAHAEGILLHKTLASVRRAVVLLEAKSVPYEIIIHADNPTVPTEEYLKVHKDELPGMVYVNHFGDLGSSRNFAVKKARGKYVTFIDADDIMSKEWLLRGVEFLEAHPYGEYIAHPETTVEFGGSHSYIIKHGEIDQATDTLLSVYANRWNSIIMTPRTLLLEEPYTPNSPGFGYEDWHLNCRLILRGIHNRLIPETAIFVRRKASNSEWLRQIQDRALLRANPLFAFKHIRGLPFTKNKADVLDGPGRGRAHAVKKRLAPAIRMVKRFPAAERYARKAYVMARDAVRAARVQTPAHHAVVPEWLVAEWRSMHTIEKQLFPSAGLLATLPLYDSLTPEHYQAGETYKTLIDCTSKDTYDYILFVPWLIKGGADLVAINYANTLKRIKPHKNILVIATLPTQSLWTDHLEDVDFIPFGEVAGHLSPEVQMRVLEQLVENSGASTLHVINSELGYNFIASHEVYLRATNKTVVATSFSQTTYPDGHVSGYSHSHLPTIYNLCNTITSDNEAVLKMWADEYGFDPSRLVVHYQPVSIPKLDIPKRPLEKGQLRVLWASRLSPEKQPAILADIGRLLQDSSIVIDMYGHTDAGFDTAFLRELPPNVHYKGSFDGFYSLPLQNYDVYLYTSLFDGMPNVLLEAAAAKLPIISSAVGGVPTLITDKKTGLLIEDLQNANQYASALQWLLDHPEALEAFSDGLYSLLQSRHSRVAYNKAIESFAKKIDY